MKVKFKEKTNLEEKKKAILEELILSNQSIIRPVCVCVCVCVEGTTRSVQAGGSQMTLLFGRQCSKGAESGKWPVKSSHEVLGTLTLNPALESNLQVHLGPTEQ